MGEAQSFAAGRKLQQLNKTWDEIERINQLLDTCYRTLHFPREARPYYTTICELECTIRELMLLRRQLWARVPAPGEERDAPR